MGRKKKGEKKSSLRQLHATGTNPALLDLAPGLPPPSLRLLQLPVKRRRLRGGWFFTAGRPAEGLLLWIRLTIFNFLLRLHASESMRPRSPTHLPPPKMTDGGDQPIRAAVAAGARPSSPFFCCIPANPLPAGVHISTPYWLGLDCQVAEQRGEQ